MKYRRFTEFGEVHMPDHVTRYSVMPIAPNDVHTTWFSAGTLRLGVEYRLLTDAVTATATFESAQGDERGQTEALDDRGVSIHVYATQDGEEREFLRFDCFLEDPHYHYISWRDRTNEMLHMDPPATGDPVEFALDCVATRLPGLLTRAGAADVVEKLDLVSLEAVLPQVRAEALRLRAADAPASSSGKGDIS
ncbi:MAG: hypothetical protein ACI8W3_003125 [Myxococcota bacterium]